MQLLQLLCYNESFCFISDIILYLFPVFRHFLQLHFCAANNSVLSNPHEIANVVFWNDKKKRKCLNTFAFRSLREKT